MNSRTCTTIFVDNFRTTWRVHTYARRICHQSVFCRSDRADNREGLIQLARPPWTLTDEWNSRWPTLFCVNLCPSPLHVACIPFAALSTLLFLSLPPVSQRPPLPPIAVRTKLRVHIVCRTTDVTHPLLTSRPGSNVATLSQEDNVLFLHLLPAACYYAGSADFALLFRACCY